MIILFLIMAQQWTSFLNPQPIYNIASNGENIWAATNGGILGYEKSTTNSFQHITNTSGIPNNQIVNVAIDKYGNIWFLCASTTGGVIVISPDMSKKRLFTFIERVPSYNFSSICIDGDSVWVGTEDNTKIWFYDMKGDPFNSSQQGVVLRNLQPSNEVKKIKIFEGIDIWKRYNTSNSGISNNNISAIIVEGTTGAKWIGTNDGGVVKFDGTNWTVFNESNSGLPDNHIQALAIEETTGDKWIGTNDGGLVK
ncbi:MAG: hypothetical protein PHE49_10435, partial [bacterium]|nr:hypothetical protein [bacterium]